MSVTAVLFALALTSAPETLTAQPGVRAPQEDPPLSASCRQALERDWDSLASERDDAAAVRKVTALQAECAGDREPLGLLMAYQAEIDLRAGRFAQAVERIERAPLTPADPIWATSRWTLMALLEATGEADRFRQVRDQFVAAHDRALAPHPRHRLRKVERFETPVAVVDAYEGAAQQGGFRRLAVFVARPRNGGMPVTLTLTRSTGAEALMGDRGGAAYFFDLYPCGGHANLGMPRGTAARPPSYAAARAKAREVFSSAETFPAFEKRERPRFCAFESYMFPGFDPAEEAEH